MTAKETLKEYWGYDSFRPMQEDIINDALSGRDVLAIMPTGGGKSVCFQVPALMKEGIALVVTPLIALMKDQVQGLERRGIRAIAVHAGMDKRDVELALNNAAYGDYKFLYLSPERLKTRLFHAWLSQMNVSFIVVDEAHCISQWGYDFRPNYLEIGEIRKTVDAPVIALTATATPLVAEDIMDRLAFKEKNLKISGFERENLSYIVRRAEDKPGQLLSILNGVPGSGIVYVRNRSKAEELSAFLRQQGIPASFYHAGLGSGLRTLRQEEWTSGKTRVIVSTNAFGMGIDKADVRFVVHYDLPDAPEAYFQEAGRAGRDGAHSWAVLLWNDSDLRRLKQIESVSFPSLEFIEDIYQKIHIFYEIPYETGAGREIKLDLKAFCHQFKLQLSPVFYAMKYLEREGHWAFTEDADIKTRVMITAERSALYGIDLPDHRMVPLLESLMRTYTGLFSYPVPIDEDFIAAKCGVSVSELRQLLYGLSINHVIRYIPADHSDILFIMHERLTPGNVKLSPERYRMLRSSYRERVQAMVDYVEEEDECRSRFLLRYFGQEAAKDCGRCDICRSRKSTPHKDKIKEFIRSREGRYTLEELRTALGPGEDGYLGILREMIDRGEVPPYKK